MPKIDLSSITKKNNLITPTGSSKIKSVQVPPKQQIKPATLALIEFSKLEKPVKQKINKLTIENIPKLTDLERAKRIKLLELYQIEFPEELQKYQTIKFAKCSDEELIRYKEIFEKNVSFTNNLDWGVSISQQALQLYEALGKMGGLEINGISKLGGTPEWKKSIKAVLMKYMDAGVTFYEPENQLIFLLIKESLTLHMLNSMNKPIQPKRNIKVESDKEQPKHTLSIGTKLELKELNKEFNDLDP
jgi:hypothetical protein